MSDSLERSLARVSVVEKARDDLSKLSLIGYLAKDPEIRLTKHDKEFVSYTVATRTTLPIDSNGYRPPAVATFHKILCFSESPIKFLSTLKKGTRVYVEANFELREPEAGVDPTTPQGQRQIFLRHEQVRVLAYPKEAQPPVHTEEPF